MHAQKAIVHNAHTNRKFPIISLIDINRGTAIKKAVPGAN